MSFLDALFGNRSSRSTMQLEEQRLKRNLKRDIERVKKTLAEFKPSLKFKTPSDLPKDASPKGTIYLPTETVRALWIAFFLGQISDGIWENAGDEMLLDEDDEEGWSRLRYHWVYWSFLKPIVGSPARVVANAKPLIPKREYKLEREKDWLLGRIKSKNKRAPKRSDGPLDDQMLLIGSVVDPDYDREKLHADIRSIFKAMASAWKK